MATGSVPDKGLSRGACASGEAGERPTATAAAGREERLARALRDNLRRRKRRQRLIAGARGAAPRDGSDTQDASHGEREV
jgi:hypothetical protein